MEVVRFKQHRQVKSPGSFSSVIHEGSSQQQPLVMRSNHSVLYCDRDSALFNKEDIRALQEGYRPREVKAEASTFTQFL